MNINPFESGVVGAIEVKNRIFRSATFEGIAEQNGRVSKALKEMYRDLSAGEVGLIITGYMNFSVLDNPPTGAVLLGEDADLQGLKELTDIARENKTAVVAQISHNGSSLMHKPRKQVYSVWGVTDPLSGITPEPLSTDQIKQVVKEFGQAAKKAKMARFDGVQIHAAHGYLLSKFLSPVFNNRKDEYGGSPQKNARILIEILNEIKTECGGTFPVWVKLNASDCPREENGFEFDQSRLVAAELVANGIDAIEVSSGTATGKLGPSRTKKHEAYNLEYAATLRQELDVPVIVVGGFRKLEAIENAFIGTDIDAVSLCRPLIRQPGLVKMWQNGDKTDAECVACNGCFNPNGAKCFYSLEGEEKEAQKQVMKMMAGMRGK